MKYLLPILLLLPLPALAHEHYPAYICQELIVSLVEAVELEIINEQEAGVIMMDCAANASWSE